MQEQPPGYNMVRVDVANMEQQAQEAEGAQARSVIPSITQTYCIADPWLRRPQPQRVENFWEGSSSRMMLRWTG